ncbi:DapH/DapD/GlmU-related protein [Aeromicrobium sp.]|uniref:acyltransferase n=1 Tax=Aeromicrobium sp. TaxID=1871063 RepID=UPI00199B19AA|nr:DapH/DapD/GlmU-related protein [Aeromicrobium sp.]MBC7632277.1 hypothetical protein [Aeromicrobium sp.]
MRRTRAIAQLLAWLLPASSAKNTLLRAVGHNVHQTARARVNVVWKVEAFAMNPNSRIGLGNIVKNMRSVSLGEGSSIGRLNVVSSHPVFVRNYPSGATLTLDAKSKVTSRHQLDCSGSVHVGELSSIAGHQTRVMTHSIDIERDAQAAHPVHIGDRSFVGTRCLILGGAALPSRSILAAGSVLPRRSGDSPSGLWAGVPAQYKAPVSGAWFERKSMSTSRLWIPETDTVIDGSH